MTISIGQIRIPVIATILVLIGLGILLNLGFWQVERADEKRALLEQIENRKTMTPVTLEYLDKQQDKGFYHLKLDGEFLPDNYVLLDNRIVKGQAGFEVIQPYRVGHRTILINRGWIPLPKDRTILPKLPLESGYLQVSGIVYEPTKAIVLKEDQLDASTPWPKLIQSLDMNKLTVLYDELGLSIEPWILRQDPDSGSFFKREWLYVNMTPERHISYAVTWFGLAFALVIIYIAALLKIKEKNLGERRK